MTAIGRYKTSIINFPDQEVEVNKEPVKVKCYFNPLKSGQTKLKDRCGYSADSCEISLNKNSQKSTVTNIDQLELGDIYSVIWNTFLSPIELTASFWLC